MLHRDLSTELAANRAAAAGDHDHLIGDKGADLIHIDSYGFPPEQIFHRNILHGLRGHISGHQCVDTRHDLQFAICFLTNIQNIAPLFSRRTGNCQEDFFDLVFFHIEKDDISAADNGNSINKAPPLVAVVINDAANPIIDLLGTVQITQDHLPC